MALKNITPPDPKRLDDPRHWRDKAEEARAKAEDMADAGARETMELVAEEYEELAHKAERQRRETEASTATYFFR
jgi:hypothetical protein